MPDEYHNMALLTVLKALQETKMITEIRYPKLAQISDQRHRNSLIRETIKILTSKNH